jgi:T5SS/PEP-CTERM-associated repeat protein
VGRIYQQRGGPDSMRCLTIQNGGTLTTFTGLVGQPNGRGDVTVTGPGSLWTNFNSLQVGGGLPGSIGTLTVADGGIVNGSFFGTPITVGGGGGGFGVLRGDGTVTSTQINARGFLVPGQVGTPGAMQVFGNLEFQSGAFYIVQVNPTTASTTNVTGRRWMRNSGWR